MDYDAKKSNLNPKKVDRQLTENLEMLLASAFESHQAFSEWLTLQLDNLEAAYPSFSTARSLRIFWGR